MFVYYNYIVKRPTCKCLECFLREIVRNYPKLCVAIFCKQM